MNAINIFFDFRDTAVKAIEKWEEAVGQSTSNPDGPCASPRNLNTLLYYIL